MKKILIAPLLAAAMLLQSCTGMAGLLGGTPPQAPASVQNISRSALDFALNSFDAALYGIDFAIDARVIVPGSETARRIAAVGRRVMGFLGVADAAQRLGSSATYEEAFTNARTALQEFRQLLPARPATIVMAYQPPMTDAQRLRILRRLETGANIALR